MATKNTNSSAKSKKSNGVTGSGKSVNNQKSWVSSLLGLLKRRWWVVLLIGLLIFGVSSFAYEKYLDRQNVADMKQLLADFEHLKTGVEAETGEELYIESSCSSVGKFSESYGCSIYINNKNGLVDDFSKFKLTFPRLFNDQNRCRVITAKDAVAKGSLSCNVTVRGSNIDEANNIFY